MEVKIKPVEKIEGQTRMPGDKSISHRALLFSSLTENTVEIEGLLQAEDTLATRNCLSELGVEFEDNGVKVMVKGKGLRGLEEPGNILDAGNSGTTARLLTGLLAGQPFYTTVTGDHSLRIRPMKRITEPLQQMGALISGRRDNEHLPLSIRGYDLLPVNYALPVASAQVKSSLLAAALYSHGVSEIIDPYNTRDHTERMLSYLGADIKKMGRHHIIMKSPSRLEGEIIRIPGDISAAAFFIVAAVLAPRGELQIEGVGINPSRTGIIDVLRVMGADIQVINEREYNNEPVGDLLVRGGGNLKGIEIGSEMIPRLIDEIPVITVAAIFAEGETVIKGASELRVKESDRIQTVSRELQKMGASIQEMPDGLVIRGGDRLNGARCSSHGDHRLAMALATAAMFAENESIINGSEAADNSFPHFFETMNGLAS